MITTEIVTLTPALAAELLKNTAVQRPLSIARVAQYAADARNGRWMLNGETIIVDQKGKMLNGQHRCRAVIISGTPIKVIIVSGVASTAMDSIDTGKPRSVADALARLEGIGSRGPLAAILALVVRFDNFRHSPSQIHKGIPNPVALAVFESDREGFLSAASTARTVAKSRLITAKTAGWHAYVTGGASHDWLAHLSAGTSTDSSAAAKLHSVLVDDLAHRSRRSGSALGIHILLDMLIRAYVADQTGMKLRSLKPMGIERFSEFPAELAPKLGKHIIPLTADFAMLPARRRGRPPLRPADPVEGPMP